MISGGKKTICMLREPPGAPDLPTRRSVLQSAAAGALVAGAGLGAGGVPGAARAQTATDLVVEFATVDDPDFPIRTYNGNTPGPTLRVNAGKALRVNLFNRLPAETAEEFCPENQNTLHANNTTNFHTHGLHVSPYKSEDMQFDADNIFLSVVPKDQEVPDRCDTADLRRVEAQFSFELPPGHPPGTFWYHAHKHGSTALQVTQGLAGPLIVNDPQDHMPPYIENAREDVFLLQRRNLSAENPGGELTMVRAFPDGGGEMNPVIRMRPGEVRRWRFINAAPSADAFVSLNFQDAGGITPEVWQIAFDGLTFDARRRVEFRGGDPWEDPASLAPGNRTDFMIRIPRGAPAGRLRLLASQPRLELLHEVDSFASRPIEMTVIVGGDPVDDDWSQDDWLPGPGLEPIGRAGAIERKVEFGFDEAGGFAIDGKKFNGEVKEPKMKRDSVGEWTVTNVTGVTHPFHIHVNPFFITHIQGEELDVDDPRRRWQDTIALPAAGETGDGEIRFLTRFETFTGKFVIHCHILRHEDTGMMQAVEVIA